MPHALLSQFRYESCCSSSQVISLAKSPNVDYASFGRKKTRFRKGSEFSDSFFMQYIFEPEAVH